MLLLSDNTLTYLRVIPAVILVTYLLWLYFQVRSKQPEFKVEDIIYQERFASGASQKNILTKIGGSRNCLRLVVTSNILWVTSWFPFSLFSPFFDLEHIIPLETVISVSPIKFLGKNTILLTYRDKIGDIHTLRLIPRNLDLFIQSLGPEIEDKKMV